MAKKISEQPEVAPGTVFDGSEIILINVAGTTYKSTALAALTYKASLSGAAFTGPVSFGDTVDFTGATVSGLTKSMVGLPLVDNTPDSAKPLSADAISALAQKIDLSLRGAVNGVASLDATGKVPSAQIPGGVDAVQEYPNFAAFPSTGSTGVIYLAADTSKSYRWGTTVYVEIVASPGSTDAVTEGSVNLYFTVARVRAAVLTGLSVATNAVISATDTMVGAFGKIQAQISAHFGSGGAAHATATTSVAGFLSAADKVKIDTLSAGGTSAANLTGGVAGQIPVQTAPNTTGFAPKLYFSNDSTLIAGEATGETFAIAGRGIGGASTVATNIEINGGQGSSGGAGGYVSIQGGYGTSGGAAAGSVYITGGRSTSGTHGKIVFTAANVTRMQMLPSGALTFGTSNTAYGTTGQVLTSQGDGVPVWATPAAGGVTSVAVSGGTTGLTTSGGPITSSGTITLAGTLAQANGGTGFTSKLASFNGLSPLTTVGDMIYRDSTNNIRLPIGSTGQVLTVAGGVPTWAAAPTPSSATNLAGGSANAIPYQTGAGATAFLAAGTSGYVLTAGSGGALSWTAPASGTPSTIAATTTFATGAATLLNVSNNSMSFRTADFAGTTGAVVLRSGQNTGTTGTSGSVSVQAGVVGNTVTSGTSGTASLTGGGHNGTSGIGGIGEVRGGTGMATGGIAQVVGGTGGGTNSTGGAVNITGGTGAGTGAGGNVVISGGPQATTAGYISFLTTAVERLRILANGAWSVGTGGTATGTSGQVLTSNGASAAPSWQVPAQTTPAVDMTTSTANLALGGLFYKTITGSVTLATPTNIPAAGTAISFLLDLTNGGAFTVTWFANIKWADGVQPNLTVAGRDLLGFLTYDAGATWTGLVLGRDLK